MAKPTSNAMGRLEAQAVARRADVDAIIRVDGAHRRVLRVRGAGPRVELDLLPAYRIGGGWGTDWRASTEVARAALQTVHVVSGTLTAPRS